MRTPKFLFLALIILLLGFTVNAEAVSPGGPIQQGIPGGGLPKGGGGINVPPIDASPVYARQVVYLDVLPVAVIYDPPGDPNATGMLVPYQDLTQTTQFGTTTTLTTINSSTQVTSVGVQFAFASGSITTTYTVQGQTQTSTIHTDSTSQTFVTSGTHFPGLDDRFIFYVNPTFDVTYQVGNMLKGQYHALSNPVYMSIVPHKAASNEPPNQWLGCHASAREILAGTGNAQCLSYIVKAPALQAQPSTVKSITGPIVPGNITSAQRTDVISKLFRLDPFLGGTVPPTTNINPVAALNANPTRFHPVGQGAQGWAMCGEANPFEQYTYNGQTTSNSITYTYTTNVQWSLNPTLPGSTTGIGDVTPYIRENDTFTFSYGVNNMTTQSSSLDAKGQYGGGVVSDCTQSNIPYFATQVYYDATFGTLLFPTVAMSGQEIVGSVSSGGAPAMMQRVLIQPMGISGSLRTFTRRDGTYRVKLPAGSYTVQIVDRSGQPVSEAMSITVGSIQTTPLRLQAIVLGSGASQSAAVSPIMPSVPLPLNR